MALELNPLHSETVATKGPFQIPMANDRIEVIRRSLRCFRCGLIGILPGIGVPFAVLALEDWVFLMNHKKIDWNPAERYVHYGAFTATLGLLLTLLLAAIIAIQISW